MTVTNDKEIKMVIEFKENTCTVNVSGFQKVPNGGHKKQISALADKYIDKQMNITSTDTKRKLASKSLKYEIWISLAYVLNTTNFYKTKG